MFDSLLPAESEPISVVSSGWLWAARCFALIYTISLVGEYVAEAHFEPLNPLVWFLFTFGLRGLLSLVLLYFLFRSRKKSLAFALGLGAATAFIALFGVASTALFSPLGRSFNLSLALIVFGPITPPFAEMMRDLDTALHRVHATGAARAQPLHEAQSPRPKPQQRPQRKPRKA